jgi:hypothetical protein
MHTELVLKLITFLIYIAYLDHTVRQSVIEQWNSESTMTSNEPNVNPRRKVSNTRPGHIS